MSLWPVIRQLPVVLPSVRIQFFAHWQHTIIFFPAEHTYFRNAAVTASDETIKKHNQTSESVNSVLACSWLQRKTTLDWNHTCSCWKVFCVPTYIRLQQAVGLWQKRIDVQLKF